MAGANERVGSSSRLAFQHEVPGNLRATFRDVLELFLVVPHCFEAPNSAEGSELNEEVGVEVEKLHHQLVVAVGGGAVDRRSVPPLFSGALPAKRQVRRRHCTFAISPSSKEINFCNTGFKVDTSEQV